MRYPGTSCGGGSRFRRVPAYAVAAICVLAWALMLPTLSNAAVGYLVGTSIAVIGLYIAFAFPIYLRWRAGDRFEHGVWSLGNHYKWIDPLALLWILLICILFLAPSVPQGIPWQRPTSRGIWRTTPRSRSAAPSSCSAAGGCISANRWFKGPIRQGSEEELERIEAQLGASG